MPAFTSHLNLAKPGGGSSGLILPDETQDIDVLNANSDKIDAWATAADGRLTELETGGIPHLAVYLSSSTAIGVNALIPFNSVLEDTESNWSTSAHTYTIPRKGLWLLNVATKQSTASSFFISVRKNGAEFQRTPNTSGDSYTGLTLIATRRFAAGDVMSVYNGSISWTPLIDSVGVHNYFEMTWLGN